MKSIYIFILSLLASTPTFADLATWSQENRVELGSLDTPEAKQKIRDFLTTKLQGKKFVYLGEPTHWVHEKWEYRRLLISVLSEMGYTHFLNEMGRADAKKIDAFLKTGDESHLYKVCLYSFCLPTPRKSGFVSEELRFFKDLHAMSQKSGKAFSHYGYDIDTAPETGYADVEAGLAQARKNATDTALIDSILTTLKKAEGDSFGVQADKVFAAFKLYSAHKKELQSTLTKKQYAELYWDFRTLFDSLQIMSELMDSLIAHMSDPKNQEARRNFYQAFINREPTMFDRTRYVLESLPADAKFIVMGHNSHMAKNTVGMTISAFGIIEDQSMWRSIGEWIDLNHPGQTFNIWLGIGEGEYNSTFGECSVKLCVAPPLVGSIEAEFLKSSTTPWIISLDEKSPLGAGTAFSSQMLDLEKGNLNKAADAYFFIPKTTKMVD